MNETGNGCFFFLLLLLIRRHAAPVLRRLTSESLAPEGSEGRKQDRGKGVGLFWRLDSRASQTGTNFLLESNRTQQISHLGLLCGLDDDAVGGVVQLP